jgi:hypothetical protein
METGVACTCKPCWPLSQAVARCWDVPINSPSSASLPPKAKREPGARQRRKETDIWQERVQALGPSTAGSVCVHVGDRGADIFEFLHACRSLHTHFVVRADQNRRVQTADESIEHLFEQARGVPAHDQRPFDLPASHGRQGRATTLHLSWMSLSLLPPRHDPRLNKLPPLPVWVVRVWEEDTPEGEEPKDPDFAHLSRGYLLPGREGLGRTGIGRGFVVEEYHQCLKTGCRIQERQLQSAERLIRLLGMLSPLAVRRYAAA